MELEVETEITDRLDHIWVLCCPVIRRLRVHEPFEAEIC